MMCCVLRLDIHVQTCFQNAPNVLLYKLYLQFQDVCERYSKHSVFTFFSFILTRRLNTRIETDFFWCIRNPIVSINRFSAYALV